LRGMVVDEEGQPVPGYVLTLTLRRGFMDWRRNEIEAHSDGEGRFAFDSTPRRARGALLRGKAGAGKGAIRCVPEREAVQFECRGGSWVSLRLGRSGEVAEAVAADRPFLFRVRLAGAPVRMATADIEDRVRGAEDVLLGFDVEAGAFRRGDCPSCDLRFEMSGIRTAVERNGTPWLLTIRAGDGAEIRPSPVSDPALAPEGGYERLLEMVSPPSRRGWMPPLKETVIFTAKSKRFYGWARIEAGPWKSPRDVFSYAVECRWNPHGGRSLYDPTTESPGSVPASGGGIQ